MPATSDKQRQVLSEEDIASGVARLADEILAACAEKRPLAFVGIHNRGVTLCERVLEIARKQRADIELGSVDISLYRDDFDNLGSIPKLLGSDIPFTLEGCHVVLFDDVLFTGRTIHAAIDALKDYGRPAAIQLAVLVDRGNRELPIAANFVGHQLETTLQDYVRVRLRGPDDEEGVFLAQKDD